MSELRLGRRRVFQVIEQGYIGRGNPIHGTFSSQEEADRCYEELARRRPDLVTMGALGVTSRDVDVVEVVEDAPGGKMRRGYEDKER